MNTQARPTVAGSDAAARPLRPISFADPSVDVERREDGSIYLRSSQPLLDFPDRITDRLLHWADLAPERIFIAERVGGEWLKITYAQWLDMVRHVASGLLGRGLSAEKPIVILSGNSIDHALVAFGALFAGIPFSPVSPAYSLVSKDYGKIKHIKQLLTPGLVFADDADVFAGALEAIASPTTEIVVSRGSKAAGRASLLSELLSSPISSSLEAINAEIGPDTIAKFLLTSGSTGNPKAVINTQRMLCANQVMLRETLTFLKDEPPVIVDWLPWNHTFGGNHNVGLVLHNGGSMYLDGGKPTPAGIEETIRNLREMSPTIYFNVPKGYEALLPHLRDDGELRSSFFARLQAMFFSGAAMSPFVWNSLDELALQETGYRVPILTGLGATETAPFFMSVNPRSSRSGHVGLPVCGSEAKLVPASGKLEVRAKGPNIMPGYWREPEMTAKSFDAEGFYKLGDALKPVDPDDLSAGFDFDGRIGEDFKLASGTWVSVGPLRARFVSECAPLVRDVVVAGINRDEICVLIILDLDGCRSLNPDLEKGDVLTAAYDPMVRSVIRDRLVRFAATSTGSSTRISRAFLLDSNLSIDKGEVTDKGSINQRSVLENRATLVQDLYADSPSSLVISAD